MPRVQQAADQRITLLAETVLTTAVTAQTTTPVKVALGVRAIALQAVFAYGSGGTTCKAWVQTSLDGGATWVDIANFAFATAAGRKVASVHALASVAATDALDGTLADGAVANAILGDRFRVKYTSTGTYAGNTRVSVTAIAKG